VGSCTAGAAVHHPGKGQIKDSTRWYGFALKACDLQAEHHCFALGILYDLGIMWGVPKDTARANELFKKACLLGHKDACGMVRR
jgi:TPR repeat protein